MMVERPPERQIPVAVVCIDQFRLYIIEVEARGCTLPVMPAMWWEIAISVPEFDVFLSHNSKDKPAVEQIARVLQEQGIVPWLDIWCLTPGGDWQMELAEGVRACRTCAVFMGPNSVGAWSGMEVRLALDRAAKEPSFRCFLVLLPGVPKPFDTTGLPPFLTTYTWVDLSGGIDDSAELEPLISAVRGRPLGMQGRPRTPGTATPASAQPGASGQPVERRAEGGATGREGSTVAPRARVAGVRPVPWGLIGTIVALVAVLGAGAALLTRPQTHPSAAATSTAQPSATALPAKVVPAASTRTVAPRYPGPRAPAPGVWTVAADMHTPRAAAQAVLLTDGRVLVAGGIGANGAMASAQLYDSKKNTWTATGSMHDPRAYFTATVLPSGKVLAAGGDNTESYFASAEIYDPKSGVWTVTGSMAVARDQHTATVLHDGRVLVAGGETTGATPLASAELYDPASGKWASTGAMLSAHWDHTASLLPNGDVLVIGQQSAETYLATEHHWVAVGTMRDTRYRHTATMLPTGSLLVVGGESAVGSISQSAEIFDPRTGKSMLTAPLPNATSRHTATLLRNGLVLVLGGSAGTAQTSLESGTFTAVLFDPALGAWYSAGRMQTPRAEQQAVRLENGHVLVLGGYADQGNATGTAELYTPAPPATGVR